MLGGVLCRIKHVVSLHGCTLKEGCTLIRRGLGADEKMMGERKGK